jgi:hypothetical protein
MKIERDRKKAKRRDKDELRAEYKRSDFPKGFARGKYTERLRESSNVAVLKPEVAQPNARISSAPVSSLISGRAATKKEIKQYGSDEL